MRNLAMSKLALLSLASLTLIACSSAPQSENIESSEINSIESSPSLVSEDPFPSSLSPFSSSSKHSSSSERSSSTSLSSSSSASSSKEKTPEERLMDRITASGGSFTLASTVVESTIPISCRLDSSLTISGSGKESKQVTKTYSVSVDYTFSWNLHNNSYSCRRHYRSSNWQNNEQVDETTNLTVYVSYVLGGSVYTQRSSVTGATRWANTIQTAANAIATACAKQIGYIVK